MIAGRVVFSGRCNRCFHNLMIDRNLPAGNTAGENCKKEHMKKILFAVIGIYILGAIVPANLDAKPIWIKFKIGIFAKWSITTTGNCEDGWGLCLSFADGQPVPNFIGYDDATNKFSLKISKTFSEAKVFGLGFYDLKEDSPVDTKLIREFQNFNSQGKNVVIKKGTYKITEEGDYYVMGVDYYLQ